MQYKSKKAVGEVSHAEQDGAPNGKINGILIQRQVK